MTGHTRPPATNSSSSTREIGAVLGHVDAQERRRPSVTLTKERNRRVHRQSRHLQTQRLISPPLLARDFLRWEDPTASMIWSTAASVFSCSQMRTTVQPQACSCCVARSSRMTFAASFSFHQALLVRGTLLCCGQACQKQPSTNTTTRCRVNIKSPRVRIEGSGFRSTRKRKPKA